MMRGSYGGYNGHNSHNVQSQYNQDYNNRHDAGSNRGLDVRAGGRGPVGGGGGPVGGGRGPVGGGRGGGDVGRSGDNRYLSSQLQDNSAEKRYIRQVAGPRDEVMTSRNIQQPRDLMPARDLDLRGGGGGQASHRDGYGYGSEPVPPPVQRSDPLFWNRQEMERRPEISGERDRIRYEGSRRSSARAPPTHAKPEYDNDRMFVDPPARNFGPSRYDDKPMMEFQAPAPPRFPPKGPVPVPVSGLNSSWLENWPEPGKSKKEIWQEKERAREQEEKRKRLEELNRRERELEEKERILKMEMKRKEEERRFAELRRIEALRAEELRIREEELRRKEEMRLEEIRMREAELRRKEERLLRLEEERRREELRLLDEQRMRDIQLDLERRSGVYNSYTVSGTSTVVGSRRNGTGSRPGGSGSRSSVSRSRPSVSHVSSSRISNDRTGERNSRGILPKPESRVSSRDSRVDSGRVEKRPSVGTRRTVSNKSGHIQDRVGQKPSAFQRLGGKVSVKSRLGLDSNPRSSSSRGHISVTVKNTLSSRHVDRNKGDLKVLDQVGEVEKIDEELEELKEKERQLKLRLKLQEEERKKKAGEEKMDVEEKKRDLKKDPKEDSKKDLKEDLKKDLEASKEVDLDKIVIKKRSKTGAEANKTGKSLVVKTPNNLVAKLALKLKELPKIAVAPSSKTPKEKMALKKKVKAKYMNENLPERILYLALEKVSYDEERVYLLLSKLIQPDTQVVEVEEVVVNLEDEDMLDYEAEDNLS